jgi:molybdopterin converting factor small subunit
VGRNEQIATSLAPFSPEASPTARASKNSHDANKRISPVAIVFIPAQWRDLTGDVTQLELPGSTLGEIFDALEARFPGIAARARDESGIAAGLAVSIDGSIASRGLRSPIPHECEVHFLPAIGGG